MRSKDSSCRFSLSLLITVGFLFFGPATAARAQTFSVLYNFGSQLDDPCQQFFSGIIAQGRDGNLYSGSSECGAYGRGAAYRVTPGGSLTTEYSFSGGSDGSYPYGGLTLGTDGNFYGATYGGGFGSYGTIFKMTPGGGLTTLYTFTDSGDGALPAAPPIQGTDGNLYGTTCPGCNNQGVYGTIYKITHSGTFTVLYECDITHCEDFYGPLIQGTDGNFYGTSIYGGTNGAGVVLKITPAGQLTDLYSFDNTHGDYPTGPLVQGTDGNFYGTTLDGGASGYGVVFRMTPAGKLTVLHNMNGTTDGSAPYAGLVQATDGNFYGVNAYGGAASTYCPAGCGAIFKITSSGAFSVLYNFDMTTGQLPYTTLYQHTNGVLYGATQLGGTGDVDPLCSPGNCGVLYSLNIGAAPFASLLSTTGKVGKKIEILGQGFTGTTAVSFNGTAATYGVVSDTYLTATVPAGATPGPVTVTTPGGTLTSSKTFRVAPSITSFSPASGPVGTAVVITGESLTRTTSVSFGGVKAVSFTVNSDTQVTAIVPTGAVTGKIKIVTAGGTSTSGGTFTIT